VQLCKLDGSARARPYALAPHDESGPGNFRSLFSAVDAAMRTAAARFPGRAGVIDAASFFTPGGRYRDFMTYHGEGLVIHESDGIHLSAASDAIAARLVLARMLADRVIR
jgi:hypothetical protein